MRIFFAGSMVIVTLTFLAGCASSSQRSSDGFSSSSVPLVGNDRDEHGCIHSAGYQWCEVKQKCLRVWEEPCTSSPDASSSNSSSSATGSSFLQGIAGWTPTVQWSSAHRDVDADALHVDATHILPAGTVHGLVISAPVAGISQYRNALDQSLSQAGWSPDTWLDADGPTGTQWGYQRTEGANIQFLILSELSSECSPVGKDVPGVECKSHESKVFLSDSVTSAPVAQ